MAINNNPNDTLIDFEPPCSLLISGTEATSEVYTNKLISDLKIKWEDIKIIDPVDSKGKTAMVSIEQGRDAQTFISMTPIGRIKLLIFKNAETLQGPGASALLKTLEEPPSYAIIVLQSKSGNMLPTITSRCKAINLWHTESGREQEFDFDELLTKPFFIQSQMVEKVVADEKALIFLEDFESWARKQLLATKKVRYSRLIKELISAKRDIRHFVSAKVVLESIILRFQHTIK